MAVEPFSALTALGAGPAVGDLFALTDISDTTQSPNGSTKSATMANLITTITPVATAWTPVLGGAGGTSGQTYAFQRGLYVKWSNLVIAPYELQLTNKGTITGQAQISGLPFACGASQGSSGVIASWAGLLTAVIHLTAAITATTSVALLYKTTAAAVSSVGTTLVTGDIDNATSIGGVLIYMT